MRRRVIARIGLPAFSRFETRPMPFVSVLMILGDVAALGVFDLAEFC